jgi:glycosyltransferase involved in cell wall biosynthesis
MLVDFCLPAKNEEKILTDNVLKLKEFLTGRSWPFAWHLLIVVNGSHDRSAELAAELARDNPEAIGFLALEGDGKGRAVKAAWLASDADILVMADVDLAVAPESTAALLAPILNGESDLVIGSRLLPASQTDRSWGRSLSSRGYNFLSRLLLRHDFSDLQCGFKAVRAEVFKALADRIKDDYWFFDTEMVVWAQRLGYRVKEVPVNWRENRYARRASRLNVWTNGWRFLLNLLILRQRLARESGGRKQTAKN